MRKQSWLSRIMFFLNVVLTIVTFIAYSLPFLAPKAFPFLSVFSLGLPFLLFLLFIYSNLKKANVFLFFMPKDDHF